MYLPKVTAEWLSRECRVTAKKLSSGCPVVRDMPETEEFWMFLLLSEHFRNRLVVASQHDRSS
jgi:hypothetical protein